MALNPSELTNLTLATGQKQRKVWDRESRSDVEGVPGLHLFLSDTGLRVWRLKYRIDGKEKLITIAPFNATNTKDARESLKAARKLALAKREIIEQGIDPLVKIDTTGTSEPNTFKAVAQAWHRWWKSSVDADTAAYILRRLETDVFPAIGSMQINDIKAADVRRLILSIESGKGARRFKGQGARDVAQRQHGTIAQIFRYAVVHDLAETNPAAAFKPSDVLSPRKTQHRAHIEPRELPGLLVAIDDYQDAKRLRRLALKLMSLTFVRTSELLQAQWSEFDLDNAVWKISPERMKMDRPHIVPLSRQAVAILRELKQRAGSKPYVFPGLNKQTENGTINTNSLLVALKDIEYGSVMTGHGFRGLARTVLAENGFDKAICELQLAHSNGDKVEAAYNSALYLSQRAELMQWWGDYLDKKLDEGRAAK